MTPLTRIVGLALIATSACSSEVGSQDTPCDHPTLSGDECVRALSFALPAELPPSAGNQYADDENAATFGFYLFFETKVGSGVSCATCHVPELAFTDRVAVSTGKAIGTRNAPTVFNPARLSVFLWDGRADSLWSQPLMAIENPLEMASTRLELAHLVRETEVHRQRYELAFGALPDMSTWPAAGMPGDPAFDMLPAEEQDRVNRVAANVGKGLDAYMRKNSTTIAKLDRFLAGDVDAMIPAAQRGLSVFLKNGCDGCHSGPMLTDERFHAVGLPSLPDAEPDLGRIAGLEILEANVFNLRGPYADPGPGVPGEPPQPASGEGEFRTPSLRNVTRTFPYGHDGALSSLPEVLAVHAPDLDPADSGDLLAFFEALNGDYPEKPWNNWPSPQ